MTALFFLMTIFNFQNWRTISYKELFVCGIVDFVIQFSLILGLIL